jgi:hypothetical protein
LGVHQHDLRIVDVHQAGRIPVDGADVSRQRAISAAHAKPAPTGAEVEKFTGVFGGFKAVAGEGGGRNEGDSDKNSKQSECDETHDIHQNLFDALRLRSGNPL